MRINIIGGGPAGLYFALLMKNANPGNEIVLYERNAPDATFGWGVVFSDKTLSYLRESDAKTYIEIIANFETWDNVDVVHHDEKITIRGNQFSGISRLRLLRILQHRCLELGVDLRFNHEVNEIDDLAECDLLVGADGVNSAVRQRYAEHFGPSLSLQSNKYIWYGTRKLFHGLTLTFRENDDGVFAAHSYKFDKRTSTFIVECDNATWRKAGFEEMSDADTRAYLEDIFSSDLDGMELLSNNSKWLNFLNVSNARWHYRNIVLLGDALHTAHFSIGSGTKLALEDAILLAAAFQATANVETALIQFERERRPIIEDYQEAAFESLQWFENARQFMHLPPMDLAYALMTRSKKIDYANLKRRDPSFIAAYEAHRKVNRTG
jgi:anthraniloyl-CoA monooxygenase